MAEPKWRFGGIPTEIDVKKLVERFGVPDKGALIVHDDIAECIKHPWKSSRYHTVVNAWRRKLLRDHEIDTIVKPSEGVYVLHPAERVATGTADIRRSFRAAHRGGARVARTPDEGLTSEQRSQRDKVAEFTWRLTRDAAKELKAFEPPAPPKALPRREATRG